MAIPSKQDFFSELIQQDCPICYEQILGPVQTSCGHLFCAECAKTWFETSQTCPSCRKKLYEKEDDEDGAVEDEGDEVEEDEGNEVEENEDEDDAATEVVQGVEYSPPRATGYVLRSGHGRVRPVNTLNIPMRSAGRTLAGGAHSQPASTNNFRLPSTFQFPAGTLATSLSSPHSIFPPQPSAAEQPAPSFHQIVLISADSGEELAKIPVTKVHILSQSTFTHPHHLNSRKFVAWVHQHELLVGTEVCFILNQYRIHDQLGFERGIKAAMESAIPGGPS